MSTRKSIVSVKRDIPGHWVGDGFPVRSLFSYGSDAARIDPFLLLDYAGPHEFAPAKAPRGVGEHPHRGFETVTIVYQGELEHRDSSGAHGTIGAGDVQWMTAASGLVHEEFHSERFARDGGVLEMVQLWVNLRAADKPTLPRYQEIRSSDIPTVSLEGGAGTARVIAGELQGVVGPAKTFTPVNVWDLRLKAGAVSTLSLPAGHTAMAVVQKGRVTLNDGTAMGGVELAIFDRDGSTIQIESRTDAVVLLLSGEPLNEPVVGQGPFVMNTTDEIRQAIVDYQAGRIGRLA